MEAFKKISDIVKHLEIIQTLNPGVKIDFNPTQYVERLFSMANTLDLDKKISDFERTMNMDMWNVQRLDDIELINAKFCEFYSKFSTVDKDVEFFKKVNLHTTYVRGDKVKPTIADLKSKGFEIFKPETAAEFPLLVILDLSKKKLKIGTYRYPFEQSHALSHFLQDKSIYVNAYGADKFDASKGTIKAFQNGNREITHINLDQAKEKFYALAKIAYKKIILAVKK